MIDVSCLVLGSPGGHRLKGRALGMGAESCPKLHNHAQHWRPNLPQLDQKRNKNCPKLRPTTAQYWGCATKVAVHPRKDMIEVIFLCLSLGPPGGHRLTRRHVVKGMPNSFFGEVFFWGVGVPTTTTYTFSSHYCFFGFGTTGLRTTTWPKTISGSL